MRLVCISDIHNKISKLNLPDGDLLCIAGDLTGRGSLVEFASFNNDLGKIKNKYKHGVLLIYGNHDLLPEKDFGLAKSTLTNVNHILHENEVTIDGIKFWGSPFSPRFYNWAFNVDRGPKIKEHWDRIPNDVDVLITHGPPYGILDDADLFNTKLGCKDLLDAVLRVKPKVHMFGHIHGGYGIKDFHGITFINASSCDERYMPVNAPIEFEV